MHDKELYIYMYMYLAASDIAPMATTILLLVADMPTEILSLFSQVCTWLLNRVSSTATDDYCTLSAGRALSKVTEGLTRVDNI